jgi:IS5 family transposase
MQDVRFVLWGERRGEKKRGDKDWKGMERIGRERMGNCNSQLSPLRAIGSVY